MYPLLVLSTLSVGFYLFLLLALHRDARRRRKSVVVEFGDGTPISLPDSRTEQIGSRSHKTVFGAVSWDPVTRIQWKIGKARSARQSRQKGDCRCPAQPASQVKCG